MKPARAGLLVYYILNYFHGNSGVLVLADVIFLE